MHCKRAAVLNDDVGEPPQVLPQCGAQHVLRQVPQQHLVNLAHENSKLGPGEPVMESLVAYGELGLGVEGALDVRDRPDSVSSEGFHQSAQETLRRDRPQPAAVARRAGQRHQAALPQRAAESTSVSGNIGSVQRWPPFGRKELMIPTDRVAGHR